MNDDLDLRITQALDAVPRIQVPEDFPERIMACVPQTPPRKAVSPRDAVIASIAGFIISLIAVIALNPMAHASPSWDTLQLFFCFMLLLTAWLPLKAATRLGASLHRKLA